MINHTSHSSTQLGQLENPKEIGDKNNPVGMTMIIACHLIPPSSSVSRGIARRNGPRGRKASESLRDPSRFHCGDPQKLGYRRKVRSARDKAAPAFRC